MYNVGLSGRLIQNTLISTLIFMAIEIMQKKISGGVPYIYNTPSTFPISFNTSAFCDVVSLFIVISVDSIDSSNFER